VSWPGTERLLHDWLVADLGVRVCSELPADLAEVMPLIQAVRIGGPHDDNDPYVQIPTVSIDVFAADRAGATDLAHAVDSRCAAGCPAPTSWARASAWCAPSPAPRGGPGTTPASGASAPPTSSGSRRPRADRSP
jgi:hypothetical protein